jgi:prevent-host-death family protein
MDEKMKASNFKTECLRVMERVRKTGRKIIITKRNIPVAKIVPIEAKEKKVFGKLKGTVLFKGDIIGPIEEVWDATS